MEKELIGCLDIKVQPVGDIPALIENMIVLGEDKTEMIINEEEKKELATLFMVKGVMTGVSKREKEMEERVKEVGSPWMLARGMKTVTVPGVGTLSLTNGTNVSISSDTLRKVLVNYIGADKVAEVLEKVIKKTTYVTLQFKSLTPKE